jgi:hypothetical protein
MVKPLSASNANLINILQKVRDGAIFVLTAASADLKGGPFVLLRHLLQLRRLQQLLRLRLH